jgi:hypothetical protein
VEVLLQAMRIQWSHGYPDTPRGYDRLTHGFHEYPAGMQAAAADRCLDCLPGTSLLDPFCGSGTSLVVGMTRGYEGFGVDVSPLAAFVAAHRAWRPSRGEETLDAMREIARVATDAAAVEKAAARLMREEEAERRKEDEEEEKERGGDDAAASRRGGGAGAVPRDWRPVRSALSACLSGLEDEDATTATATHPLVAAAEPGVPGALRFCLSVALQRSQKSRGKRRPYKRQRKKNAALSANDAPTSLTPAQLEAAVKFRDVVDEYCGRVSALLRAVDPETPRATIFNTDVRDVRLDKKVDAVLTSPPYPGVYDYLSFARKVRAGSGNATTISRPSVGTPPTEPLIVEASDSTANAEVLDGSSIVPGSEGVLPRGGSRGPRVAQSVDDGRDRRAQDASRRPARVQGGVAGGTTGVARRGGGVSEAGRPRGGDGGRRRQHRHARERVGGGRGVRLGGRRHGHHGVDARDGGRARVERRQEGAPGAADEARVVEC